MCRVFGEGKNLIIVTGLSGSGKSTLSMRLGKVLGVEVLSVDAYKEGVFDRYGFENSKERVILSDLSKSIFKAELMYRMREGSSIIVEYPFSVEWQEFFDYVSYEYGYSRIVINCISRGFEDIWASRVKRDMSKERHMGHSAEKYIKDCKYNLNSFLYDDNYKSKQLKSFEEGIYTNIKGDFVYTDKEITEYLVNGYFG